MRILPFDSLHDDDRSSRALISDRGVRSFLGKLDNSSVRFLLYSVSIGTLPHCQTTAEFRAPTYLVCSCGDMQHDMVDIFPASTHRGPSQKPPTKTSFPGEILEIAEVDFSCDGVIARFCRILLVLSRFNSKNIF
jgi:hypothetical protein